MQNCHPPAIPENSCKEFVVYVKKDNATYTRAYHYCNQLEERTPSGLEVFTGWGHYDDDGRRWGALAEGEYVVNWKNTREVIDGIEWTKYPILPKIPKASIIHVLISFQRFGEKRAKTMLAYYANDLTRQVSDNHTLKLNGWLQPHPFLGAVPLLTIGDKIVAWAELPAYKGPQDED